MSDTPNSLEIAQGEPISRLDMALLAASLAITEAAGVATPESSTSRYVLLGIAALAYVKAAVGLIRAEESGPTPEDILRQHDAFGEM